MSDVTEKIGFNAQGEDCHPDRACAKCNNCLDCTHCPVCDACFCLDMECIMPDDETTTVSVSMAAYENQIANLQESIDVANGSLRALCELAVRTEEFSKLSGMAAKKWLVQRGYTDKEAAHLIASVIRGRLVNARPTLDRR